MQHNSVNKRGDYVDNSTKKCCISKYIIIFHVKTYLYLQKDAIIKRENYYALVWSGSRLGPKYMSIKHRTSPSVLLQHFLDTDAHNLLSKSHVILLSSFEKKCSNFSFRHIIGKY